MWCSGRPTCQYSSRFFPHSIFLFHLPSPAAESVLFLQRPAILQHRNSWNLQQNSLVLGSRHCKHKL